MFLQRVKQYLFNYTVYQVYVKKYWISEYVKYHDVTFSLRFQNVLRVQDGSSRPLNKSHWHYHIDWVFFPKVMKLLLIFFGWGMFFKEPSTLPTFLDSFVLLVAGATNWWKSMQMIIKSGHILQM